MSKRIICCDCSKKLTKDEISLCKKLIDPDTDEFYCINCFAEYIGCSVDDLNEKIIEFKEQGCSLFL